MQLASRRGCINVQALPAGSRGRQPPVGVRGTPGAAVVQRRPPRRPRSRAPDGAGGITAEAPRTNRDLDRGSSGASPPRTCHRRGFLVPRRDAASAQLPARLDRRPALVDELHLDARRFADLLGERVARAAGPAVPDMSSGSPTRKSAELFFARQLASAARSALLSRPSSGGLACASRPSSSATATPTRALPRSSAQARGCRGRSVMPGQREGQTRPSVKRRVEA